FDLLRLLGAPAANRIGLAALGLLEGHYVHTVAHYAAAFPAGRVSNTRSRNVWKSSYLSVWSDFIFSSALTVADSVSQLFRTMRSGICETWARAFSSHASTPFLVCSLTCSVLVCLGAGFRSRLSSMVFPSAAFASSSS